MSGSSGMIAVDGRAVLAAALALVEGLVGLLHQLLGGPRVIREDCTTHRDREPKRLAVHPELLAAELFHQAVGHEPHAVRPRPGEEDLELVAAEARDRR